MAAPMRSGHQQDGQGHRARVADSCKGVTAAKGPNQPSAGQPQQQQHQTNQTTASATNFEYDDNEWDIGIGDLIIDLDADIEKTNEQLQPVGNMAANAGGGPQASKTAATGKMHIEHSATADKGLKMKIKRTKPGTKTSEAKHEIVKSNEQNGVVDSTELSKVTQGGPGSNKHAPSSTGASQPTSGTISSGSASNSSSGSGGGTASATTSKRGSSGHRRDKASRDKHTDRNVHNSSTPSGTAGVSTQQTMGGASSSSASANEKSQPKASAGIVSSPPTLGNGGLSSSTDMNGLLRTASAPQPGPPRSVFPASTGPGPPPPSPGPPASPAAATAQGSAAKPEQSKVGVSGGTNGSGNATGTGNNTSGHDDQRLNSGSPTPVKKIKTEHKETTDVCVGTSIGTITEPDCLGPCEPGTSVTLEGIVWHETEGGVLVVNVTWRGKTYVGTLLDCTRHDWAPPRFCDSPTSDLDSRTPKGRETRSSVHSKLRNGGGVKGGRRGVANGAGPANAPASPGPFAPPRSDNKRKSRASEDETPPGAGKKAKLVVTPTVTPVSATPAPCSSPPPSPVLLECPEPNCSKKYKHINGLKYHQSHAHGSVADDDDTKDITSMSENDESNIEVPSPATPVKSPDKIQDISLNSPTSLKKESSITELPSLLGNSSEIASTPPSPATPVSIHELPPVTASSPSVPMVDAVTGKPQAVVKPAILRYGSTEEYPTPSAGVGLFSSGTKPQVPSSPITSANQLMSSRSGAPVADTTTVQQEIAQTQSFANQLQTHISSPQSFSQPPNIIIQNQNASNTQMTSQLSPHQHPPPSPTQTAKLAQFKVKPTSALMPDDKKSQQMPQPPQPQNGANLQKPVNFKKKNRKSPAGSPHPSPADQPIFGMEQSGRDEVQSPAYSDISDDGAPPVGMETDADKSKNPDKKTESGQTLPHMGQYGIYPFYSPQPHQYVVPNQQQQQLESGNKSKEPEKCVNDKIQNEKDGKKEGSDYPSKMLQQHYYPYSYMPGYPYNMDPSYGSVPLQQEDKHKEDRVKESPSPIEQTAVKQPAPIPNPIQVPIPGKPKQADNKDKHQNENHQIIKESIEMKNQMNPYMYSRQPQSQPTQQPQPVSQHHNHREEDTRRYYVYEPQRRKEQQHQIHQQSQQQQQSISDHGKQNNSALNKIAVPPTPAMKTKEVKMEEKKEKEIKQEGVKPTMETQGPPPPPTSQYAYIHPSYMQSAHYGALPFDPNHPVYRGIMVPGPYSSSPYLHPQIPRYHGPEDLSRAQPPTKTLDMLQHHAQYYSSHKIHELQERAIKSPTPKTSVASSSPSTNNPPPSGQSPAQISVPPTSQPPSTAPSNGKQTPGDNKDSRSPPPQRHVHTHHHTHVGLGYPMYAAPYGAAVLASQQAAAVTVINPYPTK